MLSVPIVIIEAPSPLGLMPPALGRVPGVFQMPERLKAVGLAERLGAEEGGRVVPPPYSPTRDPQTGIRNVEAIRAYSVELSGKIGEVLDSERFPLVLGGDCSILLGSALALRKRGRYGLFFIDGHQDFLSPATSRTGGAAGMDLALATGRGPEVLTDFDGLRPLVRDEDVVLFGYRDLESPTADPAYGLAESEIFQVGLDAARQRGMLRVIEEGLERLRQNGLDGVWIHLDVDVLDDDVMPAVDSRQAGGMQFGELSAVLQILLGSGIVAGMQVTIYDPDLDPTGAIGSAFVEALVEGFAVCS